jgi:tetratricopeptide (TPR) repeat protein
MMGENARRPYPGPRPFRHADQTRFFGRADDTALLAKLWRINRLTLVVGETGRGKTSLLGAGVLPSVADDNLTVLPVGQLSYGAAFPFAALPAHNPYTLALLRSWSPGETATRLADLTIQEFIRRQPGRGPILAAVDSADDLLAETGARTVHRQRFLSQLAEALKAVSRFHLLVVAREEATSLVADALGNGIRFDVTKLSWLNALDAVTQPTVRAGRSFGDGAVEKLLADLQTSHITGDDGTERDAFDDQVEPALLQVVCDHLWESLPTGVNVITPGDVRRYGDVDSVLAEYWGTVIAEVAEDHDITVRRLHSWLRSTFITVGGTRNKAYEGTTTTAGMTNSVVRALQDRYLLTCRPQSDGRWYELVNDRLIEPLRKAPEVRAPAVTPSAYLGKAERALALGELDLAERHAMRILRLPLRADARFHAEARTLLGNIAFEREKPEEAEDHYRKAAELFGAVSDTQAVAHQLAAVGQTLVARGRFAEAVEELHAAADRIPNDLVIQVDLALALWQLGAGHAAVTVLTRALGIDGSNVAALRARGEILADLGEARDAILDLDRVVKHGPPSARAARGLALAELGDKSAARKEVEDAVAQARRNGPVLLYAARAFHESGDDSAARHYAMQAADATDPPLSPEHRKVARQLAGNGRR